MPLVAPLVALGTLTLVLWVIATATAIAVVVGYITGWLQGLPFPLNKMAAVTQALAEAVTAACGKLESGVDGLIGAAWHSLARLTDALWEEIEAHSGVLARYGGTLGKLIDLALHLKSYATHAAHSLAAGIGNVRALSRALTHLERRVKVLEHDVAHGIGEDVLPRVKSLDRELHHLEHKVIPKIRQEAQAAEGDVTALGQYVRDHYLANTTDAIEGAVAVGLAALGLSGLRCESNPWKNNPNACGLWGDLSDLLGLALALGFALDFETFVHDAQAATEASAEAVKAFVGLAG